MTRKALEQRWLELTRTVLPELSAARGWPITADHCFMRVLLDNACGGHWVNYIDKRPAYAHAPDDVLTRAVALAEDVSAGRGNLHMLNQNSLAWRGKAR